MKRLQSMDDTMSIPDFNKLRTFIKQQTGINLNDAKKIMLETRVRKRCLKLGILSFKKYTKYILDKSNHTDELDFFIDLVTTNKTDFFREPHHFDYLESVVLPEFSRIKGRSLNFWSAACSKGAEPYTLVMVLEEFYKDLPFGKKYEITATDISLEILGEAQRAVYSEKEIEPIPMEMRKKYLLKSKDKKSDLVRIAPSIRSKVAFKRLNLNEAFHFETPLDVIFCRNVMIYFDRETQTKLVHRMVKNLRVGGYLFMGHSELLDIKLYNNLTVCAPSIYKRIK